MTTHTHSRHGGGSSGGSGSGRSRNPHPLSNGSSTGIDKEKVFSPRLYDPNAPTTSTPTVLLQQARPSDRDSRRSRHPSGDTSSAPASATATPSPPVVPSKSSNRPRSSALPPREKRRSATPELVNVKLLRSPTAPAPISETSSAAASNSIVSPSPRSATDTGLANSSSPSNSPALRNAAIGSRFGNASPTPSPRLKGVDRLVAPHSGAASPMLGPAAALDPADLKPKYVPGTQVVKVLDFKGRFIGQELRKLLTDHPLSLVVSVIGRGGVGKSTILSSLATSTTSALTPSKPSSSSTVFPTRRSPDDHAPRTSGVDAYVTSQRVVLLDVQPTTTTKSIFALMHTGSNSSVASSPPPSVAGSTTSSSNASITPPTSTAAGAGGNRKSYATIDSSSGVMSSAPVRESAHLTDMANVQMMAWLLIVSDVVLVVSDEHMDRELVHSLRLAHELVVRTQQPAGVAALAFIKNRVSPHLYTPRTLTKFTAFVSQETRRSTKSGRQSGAPDIIPATMPSPGPPLSLSSLVGATNLPFPELPPFDPYLPGSPFWGGPVYVYLVPDMAVSQDEFPMPAAQVLRELAYRVLAVRRRGNRLVPEAEWLKSAGQAWEFIKRSGYLLGE
ncbi:hypothetical protein BCR44DRAFT_47087 [Catenaria anguillulae PL171]|uniref:Uncharacterized protein n=1 Tax=Catenaria anguillulae PL171 TaxID=765915 RepID=A0A1Y2H4T2_9FUNG|nr:hypothetical protein BCR44DRAFT_47087 [Catenaria anguillulae PL171]